MKSSGAAPALVGRGTRGWTAGHTCDALHLPAQATHNPSCEALVQGEGETDCENSLAHLHTPSALATCSTRADT